jgi:hypothetical protein
LHQEPGGGGELVGGGGGGDLKFAAAEVGFAAQVADGCDSCASEGDIYEAFAPGATEGVADDDGERGGFGSFAQGVAQRAR